MRFASGVVIIAALLGCKGNINNNDLTLPITSRISLDSSGVQANGFSDSAVVSDDGRWVAFRSAASNLVDKDPGGFNDIFLRDTLTGQTWKLTVYDASSDATVTPTATPTSTPIGTATATAVPVPGLVDADDHSFDPAISADGSRVAFATFATNLSYPPEERVYSDIYVTDLSKTMTRVSVPQGSPGVNGSSSKPSLNRDGRAIAFQSDANNLVAGDPGFTDIFLWTSGSVKLMSKATNGNSTNPVISADGAYIVFQSACTTWGGVSDFNGATDVFRVDTASGTIELVSIDETGTQSANAASFDPVVSADGRYVVFASLASDLVAPGIDNNASPDIYMRDMLLGVTTRVSVSIAGSDPDGACLKPSVSGDGQFVAFESPSTNLIGLDTNNSTDVFVRNLVTGETQRASVKTFGGEVSGASSGARLSLDGKYVSLGSVATTLVEKDTNALPDVFLRGPLK